MTEVRVETWAEVLDQLFDDAWNPSLGRYRSPFAFRGLSDARYRLETSLMRIGGPYENLERHLLRNFRKYAHQRVVERDSLWHWLTVAQHYGLPTRLLDWTYSPLVALHFCTANLDRYHLDGAVWMVDYVAAKNQLPQMLEEVVGDAGSHVFTIEMLHDRLANLAALDSLDETPFLLFFEPPALDDRIVNQYALFSMVSDPQLAQDAWLAQHPQLWRKVVIPAELKWEIRDKLDQSNITERVLFPGLDGLSQWLRRHYSPASGDD